MKKGMKNAGRIGWIIGLVVAGFAAVAQQPSAADQRMTRDIEVAENILGTMLRQESGRRGFFGAEVKGNYVPGYGVTLRLPVFGRGDAFAVVAPGWGDTPEAMEIAPGAYSYSYSYRNSFEDKAKEEALRIREKDQIRSQTKPAQKRKQVDLDSAMTKSRKRFMDVAKNFLADYGDVIGGLKPEERIVVTNRSDNFEPEFEVVWISGGRQGRRALLSVETRRGDIEQLKQGKINRDEFMKRLKVIDAESSETVDPDLEVFSSLFGRLYREDLSSTYYAQGNLNYERMKDFGVIYYMKVYSSMETDPGEFSMPTLQLRDVPQDERNKKVKELYPRFESDLKDNIVEYGRTIRSLKDNEQLVFQVRLTKCEACGIPESLEMSINASALKDYSSGKASKEATLAKINVKKTGVQ